MTAYQCSEVLPLNRGGCCCIVPQNAVHRTTPALSFEEVLISIMLSIVIVPQACSRWPVPAVLSLQPFITYSGRSEIPSNESDLTIETLYLYMQFSKSLSTRKFDTMVPNGADFLSMIIPSEDN